MVDAVQCRSHVVQGTWTCCFSLTPGLRLPLLSGCFCLLNSVNAVSLGAKPCLAAFHQAGLDREGAGVTGTGLRLDEVQLPWQLRGAAHATGCLGKGSTPSHQCVACHSCRGTGMWPESLPTNFATVRYVKPKVCRRVSNLTKDVKTNRKSICSFSLNVKWKGEASVEGCWARTLSYGFSVT